MLLGGESVQICMLGILPLAKPQGQNQILKILISFVSITCKQGWCLFLSGVA